MHPVGAEQCSIPTPKEPTEWVGPHYEELVLLVQCSLLVMDQQNLVEITMLCKLE
jgi:hypothetical protein